MIPERAPGHNEVASPLPKGWRWVRLGEVCHIIAGQSPPGETYRKETAGLPFFQGKADFGRLHPVARMWCVSPVKMALPGDILISVRAPVGPTNVADVKCCIGRGLTAIRAREVADGSFVLAFLRLTQPRLAALGSGSTFSAINRADIEGLLMPLPPLPEQQRIAALLTEQMAAVEEARAAAEAQLEATKALPATYLREVFESQEAKGWPRKTLGDAGKIISGVTLGRRLNGTTRPVRYLRVANVKDGYLDLSDVYETEATEGEIEKLRLRFGDLLLTEGGDPDKLGRGTFWQEEIRECIHQNHIFRVRFDLTRIAPYFVAAQLASWYGKSYFLAHAKQTTGIATINQRVLGGFPLMLPPFSEQQRIATRLDDQMAAAEQLRRTLEEQLDHLNKLPAALLRRAFSGEL
ncbi:MAG: restriction endonuclease subunit S [Pseudomonadota bacterium]